VAAKTWSAAGAGAWSVGANWSGGTVPASGDTVTFDNTSVQNCTVDNIGTFDGTITVAATYSGVITQSAAVSGVSTMSLSGGTWDCAGFDFSCGTAGFTVAAAVWTQGSGTITTGPFTCNNSGGTITATSGTWNLGGGFTRSNNPTFTANGGTIIITAASAGRAVRADERIRIGAPVIIDSGLCTGLNNQTQTIERTTPLATTGK